MAFFWGENIIYQTQCIIAIEVVTIHDYNYAFSMHFVYFFNQLLFHLRTIHLNLRNLSTPQITLSIQNDVLFASNKFKNKLTMILMELRLSYWKIAQSAMFLRECRSKVRPVFKKEDRRFMENYRPITIIYNFSTLFEVYNMDLYPVGLQHPICWILLECYCWCSQIDVSGILQIRLML